MRKSKIVTSCLPAIVKRDVQEKEGHGWIFEQSRFCAGTEVCHLKTGDYTLQGFEEYFTIERKESVTEFVGSMASKRFRNELERMADIEKSFVILEFEFDDIVRWPQSSSITRSDELRSRLPLQYPQAALAKFLELKLDFPYVDFQFAGRHGKLMAGNIFKRIIERYAKFIKN